MSLCYISTNKGKAFSVMERGIERNIEIEWKKIEIDELDVSKVEEVSKDKAMKAYEKVKEPCFVEDSGFYIDGYPNKKDYPGTLVKRSGISSNIEELLETMKHIEDRNCHFVSCVTYYDGEELKQFTSFSSGMLSKEIRGTIDETARSRLWEVFIPEGYQKTLAEMTEEEREERRKKGHSSFDDFLDWYESVKLNKSSKSKINVKQGRNIVSNRKTMIK